MSDEPTSSAGYATSSSTAVHTPTSRARPTSSTMLPIVGTSGGNTTPTITGLGRRAGVTFSPSFSSPSNTAEDDQPQGAGGAGGATEQKMRKSCDYCVRMKRACDGKTPCELCTRRNKECTRSVKKKSGPAKGTKYAARRTRSQDDFGRSTLGGGAARASGSGSRLGGAVALRRTTSSDDRRFPPSSASSLSGPMVPPTIHGTSYRLASHSRPQILQRMPGYHQSDSRMMPFGAAGVGVGKGVERVFADAGAGVGGMAIGGMRSSSGVGGAAAAAAGGDRGVGMIGVAGRPPEELPGRHQQQQLGSDEGGHDSESQQLIRNFPGVLQDPSIWTTPSPEELQIARNLEPDTLGRPMSNIPTGLSQNMDAQPADERHPYRGMGRGTRVWGAAVSAGDDSVGARGAMVAGISELASTRGTARNDRYVSTGSGGGGVHDSGALESLPFDWNPQLSPQPERRAGGDVDQHHYFPQAMRWSQRQQQPQGGEHPGPLGTMPSSGGFSSLSSSGGNGLGHGARPNLPPFDSIGRGANRGGGPVGAAVRPETRAGLRSGDQRGGSGVKNEEGSGLSPPRLRFPGQEGNTFSSSDPLLSLQQQQIRHQQLQQQQAAWPWHRMTTQGQDHSSLPSFSRPSAMPRDTPQSPEGRLFLPIPSQEASRRIPPLDFPVPNISGMSVGTAATVTGAVAQPGLSTQDIGWTRPEMAWAAHGGETGGAQSLPPPGASGEGGGMGSAYVSEFGLGRQSEGQDRHR